MAFERQTARKVSIADIMAGKWVKKEGFEPSFVVTPLGIEVSRARVLGTVVNRFAAEDGNFGSLTLDDFTETIRVKTFKTLKPIDGFNVGDIVDVVGKVREFEQEIYMIPEIITRVDPNMEMLRKLELRMLGASGPVVQAMQEEGTGPSANAVLEQTRDKILKLIESAPEGKPYDKILEEAGESETAVEQAVNDLLAEGICYEPTPGKIKKI
jgi:hypothetical protein